MSGITIRVDIQDSEVRQMLAGLKRRTGNLRPVMADIGQLVKRSVIKNFEAEGRPQKWPQLSPATLYGRIGGASSKKKRGGTKIGALRKLARHKILQDTATLKASINVKAFNDRVEIFPDSAKAGTNLKYAAIHQFGGPAGRKSKRVMIPARPYLMVQDEDWTEIRRKVAEYLTGGSK